MRLNLIEKIKNVRISDDDLNIENLIKRVYRQFSKVAYVVVCIYFFLIGIFSLFGASNSIERLISIILIVLLFIFLILPGKHGRWVRNVYLCLLLLCMIVSTITQQPFGGMFSDDHFKAKFYNEFAQGFYEYSIGNDQKAIKIFKRIKPYVPNDEILNYYMWYIDAASCANNMDLVMQLQHELSEKIESPSAYEAEVLYKFVPIGLIIYDVNDENYEDLLEKVLPYQNANEEIFTLFEILARCHLETGSDRYDILKSLFLKLQNCEDNFENYEHIKKYLLQAIVSDLYTSDIDLKVIALANLYAEDPAWFFETYIWIYPQENNFFNVRWISIERLQTLQTQFRTGWEQLQKSDSTFYLAYKEEILNLGLFLGVTDVIPKIEQKEIAFSKIDSVTASYPENENACIYNILQMEKGKYIFSVFVTTWSDAGEADKVDFYMIDLNDHDTAESVMIDGEPFQKELIMGKLCLLRYSGVPGKYIFATICGTAEVLELGIIDLNQKNFNELEIKGDNYHCENFMYDIENKTCQWKFEINNGIDANMWTKVGGKATATINFDEALLKKQTNYSDPALQFYVEERNEQLIFPLATLNKLSGREIKDESLLELIRSNRVPYYHYSYIQNTINVWSTTYVPNISGLLVSYDLERDMPSEFQYFFFVKREEEKVKLLGIYRVSEKGLKSVY